jgi:hypothetical protein
MAYLCPKCTTPTLDTSEAIAFAADSRSDEITLSLLRCTRCGFRGAAVYEESRRGVLTAETWEYTGYRMGGDELAVLAEAIQCCPDSKNPNCRCPTHIILGRRSYGRWVGLRGFDILDRFPMRREGQA